MSRVFTINLNQITKELVNDGKIRTAQTFFQRTTDLVLQTDCLDLSLSFVVDPAPSLDD